MVSIDGAAECALMGNYRDLHVWQRSQALASRIDRATRLFARGHAGLGDQLRRASLSVPTNLAEGAVKGSDADFIRFISIAIGSAAEVDSLLLHATDVSAMDSRVASRLAEDLTIVRKMLFRLRAALKPPTGVISS